MQCCVPPLMCMVLKIILQEQIIIKREKGATNYYAYMCVYKYIAYKSSRVMSYLTCKPTLIFRIEGYI